MKSLPIFLTLALLVGFSLCTHEAVTASSADEDPAHTFTSAEKDSAEDMPAGQRGLRGPVKVTVHVIGKVACKPSLHRPVDNLTYRLYDRKEGTPLMSRRTNVHGQFEGYVQRRCRADHWNCRWQVDVVVTHTCNAEGETKYMVYQLPNATVSMLGNGYNKFNLEGSIDLTNVDDAPWYAVNNPDFGL